MLRLQCFTIVGGVFAAALSWWGMLIDIVLFFVLVVVVMVMAVQRIWRLRLGNWMLWRRNGQ